ncbi:ABC transporter substrate-binding protein [Streptomyces flaveolus]|uniref:ABC transporter substrate-binding protein n=1 Tax=Streptomyces flaveolus TaxID=67297 RepID=UPI003830A0EE
MRLRATSALVTSGLLLAACGTNDAGAGSSSGAITIMQIAPYHSQTTSLPMMKTSIQAAVDEINDAGGINGRKLRLETCNEEQNPNVALRCAQTAVQERAAAVVGGLTSVGSTMLPLLEKAKIPYIGPDAITPYDGKSPASFLFDAGVPGYAAMPAVAKTALGATKVAAIHNESPAAPTNQDFFEMGAELAGVQILDNIVVPLDAVDLTQYVSRAESDGAEAIVSSMSPDINLKLWKALQASGSSLRTVMSTGSVSPSLISQAGVAAEGTYLVQGTPVADDTNEWGKQYLAAMAKYEPDEKVLSGVGLRAYWAAHLFADVAKTIKGEVNSQSVWDAFNKVHGMKFAWVDSLSFDEPGPIKELPRVTSTTVFPAEIVEGKMVAKEPFDPFKR